ncbi:MAG TPA: MarC family protein [Thermoplasmata archaeon]|jgi:multiple antibiotic resistance protein|nr:MarC family protein [Thermoplasmata archaeon]
MVDVIFGVTAVVAIFAIVDPFTALPFFMFATEDMPAEQKRNVVTKACIVALVTLGVFALFGQLIFAAFGFTIAAFKIAGGILLFAIAFEMLHGERPRTKLTDKEHEEGAEQESVGIVPLGIPLLAGPGAITTVMIFMARPVADPFDKMFVFVGILISALAAYYTLNFADRISERIGRTGTLAIGRIMGLLLAAIAVQFVIDGVVKAAVDYGVLP